MTPIIEKHGDEYLATETTLSQITNINLNHPIRLFSLEALNIPTADFIKDIKPTFSSLRWDYYDTINEKKKFLQEIYPEECTRLKNWNGAPYKISDLIINLSSTEQEIFYKIKPYRKRAIATFDCQLHDHEWMIQRIPTGSFIQEKNAFNSGPRLFQEIDKSVTNHPHLLSLLQFFLKTILKNSPKATSIKAHMHQVGIYSWSQWSGKNAPEGIHKDGADYIVSAIVIDRFNIKGGKSAIFLGKNQKIMEHTLEVGEGIFQADEDSPYYHHVTPIQIVDENLKEGYREIIGFDFHIHSV